MRTLFEGPRWINGSDADRTYQIRLHDQGHRECREVDELKDFRDKARAWSCTHNKPETLPAIGMASTS